MESNSHHQAAVGLWMNIVRLYAGGEMVTSISTQQSEQWELGLNEAVNESVNQSVPSLRSDCI